MITPERPNYNSQDLRLHRKYILVLCFILVFLKYGGVKVEQVSFLGTSFSFENSHAIFLGLWIILFYSIFRYYQFFRHESWGHVQSEFRTIQDRVYHKKFMKLLRKAALPRILASDSIRAKAHYHGDPRYFSGLKKGVFSRRYNFQVPTVEFDVDDRKDDLRIYTENVAFEYHLLKHFWWQTIRASWHYTFNTPFFFEFLFPFLLLAGTIIYCGFTNWEGSLIHLFF